MKAIRIPVDFWQEPPLSDAGDAALGCWIKLVAMCARKLNGGLIPNCRSWSNTTWTVACGLDASRITQCVEWGVCFWQGDSLLVLAYPIADEVAYKAQINGSGKRSKCAVPEVGSDPGSTQGKPYKDRIGEDRIGKEGTGLEARPPTPAPPPRPGPMELGSIPGLQVLAKDRDKLLAVAHEVGLEVLAKATREVLETGQKGWESNVTPVAYRIHRETKKEITDVSEWTPARPARPRAG